MEQFLQSLTKNQLKSLIEIIECDLEGDLDYLLYRANLELTNRK